MNLRIPPESTHSPMAESVKRRFFMERKRVLFCFHTHDHEVNFGVASLSATLKRADVETDLVIYREMDENRTDTPESVASRIIDKRPDIVAFSVMSFNWHKIERVITLIRPAHTGLIIVGGYHAILAPEQVLAHPGVDAVCVGEGEQPLLELVKHAAEFTPSKRPHIEGLVFKGDSSPEALTKRWLMDNIDLCPYLDYDIFANEDAKGLKGKYLGTASPSGIFSLPVITGRGCPYRCTYCSNSALIDYFGGPRRFIRKYSAAKAVEHIGGLADKYLPDFIEFLDETFILDKGWVRDFGKGYRERVSLPFLILSRIDIIDEPSVATLAESGLKVFCFGLECGDEGYRAKYLKRYMSNKAIVEGAKLLKKYGIIIVTFNMFGMPFETKETVRRTIALNEEIQPDVATPFIYQPFAGTELGELAYRSDMVPPRPEDRWDYCSPCIDTPELPASYVLETVNRFRERFALKPLETVHQKLRAIVASRG